MENTKSRNAKLVEIKDLIQKDPNGVDLMLSLFISAAQSFKKNFLLLPFPINYLIDADNKDFERLLKDIEQIPSLEEILVMLMAGNDAQLKDNTLEIIHWILTSAKYNVQTLPKGKHEEVLSLAKNSSKHQVPNQVFKITYNENSGAEKKFQLLSKGMPRKYAYHGTKFFNLYTILSYGLQQHLNKTGLFGEGLYFAFELQISALFSPSVLSWSKSKLGDLMSCVALCEYIDDPMHYRIQKENAKNNDIPHNYLLITNNEIVRVRYLLLYGSKKPTLKSILSKDKISTSLQSQPQDSSTTFLAWCRRNPLIVSALLYVIFLVLAGFNQSRTVVHYKTIIKDFLQRFLKFE